MEEDGSGSGAGVGKKSYGSGTGSGRGAAFGKADSWVIFMVEDGYWWSA